MGNTKKKIKPVNKSHIGISGPIWSNDILIIIAKRKPRPTVIGIDFKGFILPPNKM